jgi:hypothetical protein
MSTPHGPVINNLLANQPLSTQQQEVITTLRLHPEGLTDHEGAEFADMDYRAYARRRHELDQKGFLRKTGELRLSGTHRRSIVWKAIA